MSNIGWLVNDTLTCIPGTKTFWHDLLDWFPNLRDKTNGYTNFSILPKLIEREAKLYGAPDFIIRNGTFFDPVKIPGVKTISLIQDFYTNHLRVQQNNVINSSDIVVFNNQNLLDRYKEDIAPWVRTEVIPLGVDFNFFKPTGESDERLKNHLLFVGDSSEYPKGFDRILNLIETTNYKFCLVMKDDFKLDHNRVTIFNKIDHIGLRKIYNSCSMLLCPSREETLHLAGIEAAACNLPIVATDVGIYKGLSSGMWGEKVKDLDFLGSIERVMKSSYSPRDYFLSMKLNKESCKEAWRRIINEQ